MTTNSEHINMVCENSILGVHFDEYLSFGAQPVHKNLKIIILYEPGRKFCNTGGPKNVVL
jgi:hypothetical protein